MLIPYAEFKRKILQNVLNNTSEEITGVISISPEIINARLKETFGFELQITPNILIEDLILKARMEYISRLTV